MEVEPWQIKAARYCVSRVEFSQDEVIEFLKLLPEKVPDSQARNFFEENVISPAGRSGGRTGRQADHGLHRVWSATPDMVSMITDYDELREARKNSYWAWWISMAALFVSALGAYFQWLSVE